MTTNLIQKSLIILVIILSASCNSEKKSKNISIKNVEKTQLNSKDFDTVIQGKSVGLFWIKNKDIEIAFTNYGGRIVGLSVPDMNNKMTDVVVGFGSIKDYLNSTEKYFGATIGRVGNRIAKGKFTLENKEYSVPINNGINALHGGFKGFQDVVWDVTQPNEHTIEFAYLSPDMEEGFPGNLSVKVTYTATSNRSVLMKYEATTDKPTIVNLTNHAFFNLNGEGSGTILNHAVKFYADKFTPVDEGLIPTGELNSVQNTPFDFTSEHTIGERINEVNEQLKNGGGYDHNFVINDFDKSKMNKIAKIIGDKSGITMTVTSKEPGVQFYSGNFMKGENTFKTGVKDEYRTAFALETQHFPDAPNQSNFDSIVLNPKETYSTVSEYRFSNSKK